MASGVAPVKVDVETDALISHAAHFLDRSKKDVVDAAVREYIENHRDEINAGVRAALAQLDGTKGTAVRARYTEFWWDKLPRFWSGFPPKFGIPLS
jgi:predicted transcriptional regulator